MDNLSVNETVTENTKDLLFSYLDYSFFITLLVLSTLIGLYYGFVSKHKQDNPSEYIFGGRTMNIFPIASSMIASEVSGVTLLGLPVEIYANGSQYMAFIIPACALACSLIYIYLPLFCELQLPSSFIYLEKRFDRRIRLFASSVYVISCMLFIPIVIYVPALAFSQVTGMNLHLITPIICIVCVFYTTIGGLRAVVWTDTLQFILMMGSMFTVIILGIHSVGGFSNVWQAADRGGRLIFFNLDPSPYVRTSFWTVVFGLSSAWISNVALNQGGIQRYMALPNYQAAKRSVWIFIAGFVVIKGCSCLTGLIMYAKYENCDPLMGGIVKKSDQILPLYVMEVGRSIPGLPGLFLAGIFSAALSTMSSSLNTLSGTIYEDFLKIHFPKTSERQASNIMKIIVVVLGLISICLVFVVEKMGSIFQMALGVSGTTAGAMLGMFTLGMVTRTANTKGVIAGAISSMLLVGFMFGGSHIYNVTKSVNLPVNIDQCNNSFVGFLNDTTTAMPTTTVSSIPTSNPDEVFWMFRVSFMYYAFIGTVTSFVVAYSVSWLTGGTKDLDESLLTPLFRSAEYKTKNIELQTRSAHYAELDKALVEIKKLDED